MKIEKTSLFHSRLSLENLEALKDTFEAFDISESDSKAHATMAVGRGAESFLRHHVMSKLRQTSQFLRELVFSLN